VDVTNYAGFVEQARQAMERSSSLAIDLSAAEFLDSTALGALVALANQLRAAGGALYLVAVPRPIASLLSLVRLDRFFEILPDAEAAEVRRATPEPPPAPRPAGDGWAVARAPRIFDAGTAPLLLDYCEGGLAAMPRLVLDLSDTAFLSSAGMAALIRLDRQAREHGGELRVAGCAPDVLRTLQLVKLDAILKIYGSADEAKAAPGASPAPDTAGPLLPT
jgi:N-acetylglucosaminyldiphosphoundecaprenol N-acetyl-beta-D-mannosaminyltransferase